MRKRLERKDQEGRNTTNGGSHPHDIFLSHENFIYEYNQDIVHVSADLSKSLLICSQSRLIPIRQKVAMNFLIWTAILLPLIGLILHIWLPWYYCVSGIAGGPAIGLAVRKYSGTFVVRHALADEDFYYDVLSLGVIVVRKNIG